MYIAKQRLESHIFYANMSPSPDLPSLVSESVDVTKSKLAASDQNEKHSAADVLARH